MKVLFIGSTNSRNAAGIFNSVRMLGQSLNALKEADIEFLLYEDEYSPEDKKYYEPMPLHSYTIIGPKNVGFSLDIYKKLKNIKPDIVHTQGIWMYFSYANRKYNLTTGTPYIITTHGMLDPWQLKQTFIKDLKKRIALNLYESQHLKQASCIHAICKSEHDAIRAFGLKNPIATVPYGITLPLITARNAVHQPASRWSHNENRKTLLFLSRIHVKKGVDNLLKAWALTNPEKHNWQLVIAGETKDKVYYQSVIDLKNKLKISSTVNFIGGQYEENKETCFIDADAFILPSFSEGLSVAVMEAMTYKLPVVMTPFCNVPEGFEYHAAIEIDTEPESISSGINKLINLSDEERISMGQNGYNLVKEKFTLEKSSTSMMHLYKWVAGEKEKPDFVSMY